VLRWDAHVGELAWDFARCVTALEVCHVIIRISHGWTAVLVAHSLLLVKLTCLTTLLFLSHHLLLKEHRFHARIHAVVHETWRGTATALWLAWLLSRLIEELHVRVLWRLTTKLRRRCSRWLLHQIQ
jgi:hypothetical protein